MGRFERIDGIGGRLGLRSGGLGWCGASLSWAGLSVGLRVWLVLGNGAADQ